MHFQIHEYYLGNGFNTTSSAIAMEEFMKREFKEILTYSEKPHDVILYNFNYSNTMNYNPPLKRQCHEMFLNTFFSQKLNLHLNPVKYFVNSFVYTYD